MNRKIFSILGLGLVFFILLPSLTMAAEIHTGQQASLPAGTIQNDVYIFGGNVNSSANIIGDLIVGGGNVLVNGSVSQDLFVGGGSITIIGNVEDDLRIGGGNMNVVGSVGGDLIAGGGQLQISGNGITGDLVWGGGTLQLNAPVQGNLKLAGNEVFINAPVSGDVTFKGSKLVLGKNAVISGTLSYQSPQKVEMQDGSKVVGEVTYKQLGNSKTEKGSPVNKTALAGIIGAISLVGFLMWLAAALIFGLLLKRFSLNLVQNALSRPLAEFGRGFLALIIIPIASVILLVTIVGVPLGILGIISYIAILLVSSIMAPIVLGSLLHKWVKKPETYKINWKIILIGAIVYFVLGFIPVIGWIARCLLMLTSLGALIRIKLTALKDWR